jgi:hypothetical protein
MATIIFRSVEICGLDKQTLEFDDENAGFIVKFHPNPMRKTQELLLGIICDISPDSNRQAEFVLETIVTADYFFLMGNNGKSIRYIRQISSGDIFYLPFILANKQPLLTSLPCDLRLSVRDTNSSRRASLFITRIIGNY